MRNLFISYQEKNDTLAFAADELASHLNAAAGDFHAVCLSDAAAPEGNGDFSILLRTDCNIGEAAQNDAYAISISQSGGDICGVNSRSVLLGVYAYLRKLGFRFLLPGHTYIPADLTAGQLSCRLEKTASFFHRGVCIEGADSLENVLSFIDWLPKLGYNSFFLQFREPYIFLERWYSHTMNPSLKKEALTEEFLADCYRQMEDAISLRALSYHAVGHGWTCEAVGFPSVGWVKAQKSCPPSVRPLLAKVGGTRDFIDGIPLNTNLCYTNPVVTDRFCDTVLSYIEEHPGVDYLHIWLADEVNHICECEACQKLSFTDQYVHLLNELDRRMTEKNIDCHLVFLLYQELLYPPVTETLHNPERFTLMFAPISRTFRSSYPKETETVPLPPYRLNQMELPTTLAENLSYLREWQKQFHGDSFVYDYPLGRAHYGDFGYVGISRVISGDIAQLHALGLNGYISCQELRAFLPNGLPNYIMGHLLFDESQNFEDLVTEYFDAAYGGEHAAFARSCLTELSALSDCDYFNGKGERKNERAKKNYSQMQEKLQQMSAALTKDSRLTETLPPIHRFFLKLLDYHFGYVIHLSKALLSLADGDKTLADRQFREFHSYICGHEQDFQPYLDVYRITEVSTKYTGFSLDQK